jgi:hypothetical protein
MVNGLILCDLCHEEQEPLTETNAVSILNRFQRDRDGNPVCNARVHRECVDAWMEANGGSRVEEASV